MGEIQTRQSAQIGDVTKGDFRDGVFTRETNLTHHIKQMTLTTEGNLIFSNLGGQYGGSVQGTISTHTDTDLFSVDLTAGNQYKFTMDLN